MFENVLRGQRAGKLAARADAELGEYLAQVKVIQRTLASLSGEG